MLLRLSLHFPQLHFTTLVDTSLPPTTLHYPLIWLNPILISFRSISLHFTALLDDFRRPSVPFISSGF